jgi:hypothetical protein
MPLFTTLTPERMCQEIAATRRRVILAAPGIVPAVASALIAAHQRLPADSVQVVLDVSATVSRLGYGEHAAVDQLVKAGVPLRQQPGLRLGVLICDDHGWSYASAPRLVEAEPTGPDDACNAIALTQAQVLALRAELPATETAGESEAMAQSPVVGAEQVEREAVERVGRALEIAPPQPFDLARQTRVYHALLQFVELTFEGFSLQSRRVQLPKSLPVIASKDRALKERLSASLKLLDKMEKPTALKEIAGRLEDLRTAYLVPVGKAGRVILKGKQTDFEKELAQIEHDLKHCREALKGDLATALGKVTDSLVPDLARAVLSDPPPRFRGLYPMSQEAAETFVREELGKAFPTAEALVQGMQIHKFYKDVTYETLKNEEFENRVKELIPPSILDGALLHERTVAASTWSVSK